MRDLETLRKEIDKVDEEIAALLSKRFDVVKEIGAVKKALSLPVLNAKREALVLEKAASRMDSEEKAAAVRKVYRTIIEESKALE